MRRKSHWLFVSLWLSIFWVVTGLHPAVPEAASQDEIQEIEPNDSKEQALPLNLVPGGTVTVDGFVAQGDPGVTVAELPSLQGLLFAQIYAADPLEDWYMFEMGQSVEIAAELSWPVDASDLDIWTFTEVDRDVYPDELATHHLAASNSNPEREPTGETTENADYRLLYSYSTRQPEVEGKRIEIPTSSRYYLAVSNFNFEGFTSPPTDYKLSISTPVPGTPRSVLVDTHGPGLYAVVFPSDLNTGTLTAIQRVTPSEYPARLDRIDFLQFLLGRQSQLNSLITLLVLVDPDGTGDPTKARQVSRQTVRIEELNAFNVYFVRDANFVINSGDFYVGIEIIEQLPRNDLHIPFDIDKAGYGRTFVSTDRGKTYGFLYTASPTVGVPMAANAGFDVYLTINPPPIGAQSAKRPSLRSYKTQDRGTREFKSLSFVKLK